MSASENPTGATEDFSPAVPLEISAEQAREVDTVLQDFAETAELETALVVHSSGGLVSGISAEADVTVEVISALVASASGALAALVAELGESNRELESFHQGGGRSLYFRALPRDFILVGVSSSSVPVGLVREGARQVLRDLNLIVERLPEPRARPVVSAPSPEMVSLRSPVPEEEVEKELQASEEEAEMPGEPEEEASPPREPTEVIEVLGGEEPEIVIDGVDSSFATEAGEEVQTTAEETPAEEKEPAAEAETEKVLSESNEKRFDGGAVVTGSIFEVADEGRDEEEKSGPASIFEEDKEDNEDEESEEVESPTNIFEVDDEEGEEEADGSSDGLSPLFEVDEDDDEEEGVQGFAAFELDEEWEEGESAPENEVSGEESPPEPEAEPEESGEEEVRSSGPLYL